jgi:hypothetical protein
MARLNNTQVSAVLNWGPGYNNGPDQYAAASYYHNRGFKINNTTGNDLFLPDNSDGEKNSVFLYTPGTAIRGNWIDSQGYLRRDRVATGNFCWSGPFFNLSQDPQPNPPGCPEGYNDGGVYATKGPFNLRPSGSYSTYTTQAMESTADISTLTGYDVLIAGASREAVFFCQNLADGYFWLCTPGFQWQWIAVRACYRS